jgi:dihydroxyacid dehydratase/phosphogluconate dehydratase
MRAALRSSCLVRVVTASRWKQGMKYSLPSRALIADRSRPCLAHCFADGPRPNCEKIVPACSCAAGQRPALS